MEIIRMKLSNFVKTTIFLLILAVFGIYLIGCSDNNVISTDNQTDDEYIKEVVLQGTGSSQQDDEDLMSNTISDLDDGGPVDNGGGDTPIDSLVRWGRHITGVNVNVNITTEGDSLKIAEVTRTITGNFIIVGYVSGTEQTITKPFTMALKRSVIFKRIDHNRRPRFNWKLYKVSMVDGETTAPQAGTDYVKMNKVEVYVNNVLAYTFQGPDFSQNVFTTRRFHGGGIPEVHHGDQVKIKVYTFSTQPEPDIVVWHWARNAFGFHREPFAMTSQVPNGQYWDRTYEKTFTIYRDHRFGGFNGFISASTHKSLYDDSPSEFASDLVGTPYRVLP
jgi:hypothetical protein